MAGTGGKREGAGRPKGSRNQLGQSERERIARVVETLTKKGKGLLKFAEAEPALFWTRVYTKIIPQSVDFDGDLNVRRSVTDLSDAELAAIAAGGSPGTPEKAGGS
jgi:hypothetical protein